MYTLIKKKADNFHADKEGPPPEKRGGKLSHQELYDHHTALADHYGAVAAEQKSGSSGGINPGAETDKYAGDDESYRTEESGSVGDLVGEGPIDGEDLEDATGLQESASYEKGESDDEKAMDDLGSIQSAGGNLGNSKEQKPLSRFDELRKKKKGSRGA